MIYWNQRRKIANITATVFGVLAGMGAATTAQAQTVFAATDRGGFGSLNLSTGAFSLINTFTTGQLDGANGFRGLALDQTNNNVLAIDNSNDLYAINPSNNGFASLGFYDVGNRTLRSIAFDNTTGFFYGLASDNNTAANTSLYRLGTFATGSGAITSTLLSTFTFNSRGGLAIVNNTGYATQGTEGGDVFQFSLAPNATATDLGVAGFTNPVSALANVAGQLKAVDKGSPGTPAPFFTYNINRTTGAATTIQPNPFPANPFGNFLAITDNGMNTPEPGTIGLLATGLTMGAGGIAVRRRRKTRKAA